MDIPHGITGFIHRKEQPLQNKTDLHRFLQCSYTAAILCKGEVIEANMDGDSASHSYGTLVIKLPQKSVAVAINHIYPIIAFAEPEHRWSDPQFIDCPLLAKTYRSFGYDQILSAEEANQTPEKKMYQHLSKYELKEISYWQPRKVGQIIFNWWD